MNNHPIRRFACTMILLALAACNDDVVDIDQLVSDGGSDSPTVARVGNELILVSDVDAELANLPPSMQHLANSPEVRRKVEELLVRRVVLAQQAVMQGLDIKPEVHAQIQRMRNDILINALKSQFFNNQPIPDEDKLRAYYEQHKADFTLPEQLHAAHILLHDEQEAKDIAAKLKADPSQFSALAARYSLDDSNKARGGDLNWFPRGIMDKAFEEAAFALKHDGDLSKPVKTDSGWHIILRKGYKPAEVQSFADARREIIHILQHQAFEDWVNKLISHADIHYAKQHHPEDIIRLPEGIRTRAGDDGQLPPS